MTPSRTLFDLVHSLSRNEKRYFKRYSALHVQGKQNNYILLFDAIAGQNKYDEKKLMNKFRDHTFSKQLSVVKNYLYNQVLYAMQSYYTSIHTEARRLLQNAEFLFEKGLYAQAQKVVGKAKVFARKYELHWVLLEIDHLWEFRLALKRSDMKKMGQILEEEAEELSLMQNTKTYHDMFWKMFIHQNVHGMARSEIQKQAVSKMPANPLLKDESRTRTFKARLNLYQAGYCIGQIKGNTAGVYRYARKIIGHFHHHPEKIRLYLSGYTDMLNNAVIACNSMKKYDEALPYIREMKELSPLAGSASQKINLFYRHSTNWLDHLHFTGQFSAAVNFWEEINPQLTDSEGKLNELEKTVLFALGALSYFGVKEYKHSIYWLNRIRNEVSLAVRPDLESFLQLLYLIIHFEAKNTDLLPYQIQSTYRFLRKKEQLYRFEKTVIDYMKNKFPKANTQKEIIAMFKKLHSDILPLSTDPYEKTVFEYFDYLSWLESKIENRPFAEVVSKKSKVTGSN